MSRASTSPTTLSRQTRATMTARVIGACNRIDDALVELARDAGSASAVDRLHQAFTDIAQSAQEASVDGLAEFATEIAAALDPRVPSRSMDTFVRKIPALRQCNDLIWEYSLILPIPPGQTSLWHRKFRTASARVSDDAAGEGASTVIPFERRIWR